MIPKMDGIETLEKLKEENLVPDNTTVIALTANAVVGAKERYLEAGFDDYLSKPIEVEKLEEKLEKYLPDEIVSWRDKDSANTEETKNTLDSADEMEGVHTSDDEIMEFAPIEFAPSDSETQSVTGTVEQMRMLGIAVDDGLCYCGGDEAFYVDMLKDYATAYEEKRADLEKSYQENNWLDYQTSVHALKSTSKTIGAMKLSEHARCLEEAAGQSDIAYIEGHHPALIREYEELINDIRGIMY